MMKTSIAIIVCGALMLWAGTSQADQPETFEPGTGKYILVLKDPRTDVDEPGTGRKKAKEPDVQKHGGKVLHKKEGTRIIKLPARAAGALRKEENVAYLQRVWLGEAAKDWDDEQTSPSIKPESDSLLQTDATDLTWETGQYLYDGSGNIKQIGDDTYRYDGLGRLTQAVVNGVTANYQYDPFGNLVGSTVNGVARSTPVDESSNRLKGEIYDAAGNVTTREGRPRYNYDSLSMMDQITKPPYTSGQRYIYGPGDERTGVLVVEGQLSRWKIRDFDGKVLREYKGDDTFGVWEWIEDYVYMDGRPLAAERDPYYGGVRHFHTDHLGSVRMITDENRQRIAMHDYLPFGVEQTDATQEYNHYAGQAGSGDFRSEPMKFTGHERDWHGWLNVDNDDYLDYMHARFYDPNLGRFLSPDPVLDLKSALKSPQMWNRYAYVHNNPVNKIDPDGRLAYHWHYWITYRAAREDGMSRRDAMSLAWAVVKVDHREGSQGKDARASNTHAMRGAKQDGKSQTIKEGREGTENSIASAIWRSDLAQAIHTAQDRAAPGHADQAWKGSKNLMTLLHVKEDVAPTPMTLGIAFVNTLNVLRASRERNLNPNVYSGTVVQDDE